MAAWDNQASIPAPNYNPVPDFGKNFAAQLGGLLQQQPQQQGQQPGQPGQPMNIQPQQQNQLAARLAQLLGSFGGQPGQGTQWGVPSAGNIGGTAGGPDGTLGSIY